MDQSTPLERHRLLARDALRLLIVVRQAGREEAPWVDGEELLQWIDHLVRRPVDLAFVLIDQFRRRADLDARRAGIMRRIRILLTPSGSRPPRTTQRGISTRMRQDHFRPVAWERWDDLLAYLGCRDLLRVEVISQETSQGRGSYLRYRVTERGEQLLQATLENDRSASHWVDRYRSLQETLWQDPEVSAQMAAGGPEAGRALRDHLSDISTRVERFRRDEQISLEDDLLPRLFQRTFGELL